MQSDAIPPPPVVLTRGELVMLSVGMWLSGVCLLALLPVVLMPRLGPARQPRARPICSSSSPGSRCSA